jgi:hypothetical protein
LLPSSPLLSPLAARLRKLLLRPPLLLLPLRPPLLLRLRPLLLRPLLLRLKPPSPLKLPLRLLLPRPLPLPPLLLRPLPLLLLRLLPLLLTLPRSNSQTLATKSRPLRPAFFRSSFAPKETNRLADHSPVEPLVLPGNANPARLAAHGISEGSNSQFRPIVLLGKMGGNKMLQATDIQLRQQGGGGSVVQMTQAA